MLIGRRARLAWTAGSWADWDAGYDALMVSDTSFMRNPHDHRLSDTSDSLDLPFLAAG